jgi:hypothetical protein
MRATAASSPDFRAVREALGAWASSRSTRFALLIGGLTYLSYASMHDAWANPTLVAVALFVALALPWYSRISNLIERRANNLTALISVGRLARATAQFAFNLAVFATLDLGGAMRAPEAVGGVLAAAALTTAASQGAQFFGMGLYHRGLGDLTRNVMAGLSANIVVTAMAVAGIPVAREAFLIAALGFGGFVLAVGLLSDLRARLYPRRGVGMFFGTFNPFHASHLALIRRALDERRLDKVIVHPTIVPRLHAQALAKGEIRIARVENGLQVYEKTELADVHVDYFPTGRHFFAPETRHLMMALALEEAGLAGRVEVAFWPEIYAREGFHGVVRQIRRTNPGQPLHGLHGSDLGGMYVRAIMDECGWIYPMPFLRRDKVSATAIRAGASGMTTPAVTAALEGLRAGLPQFNLGGRTYRNERGTLIPA